MGSPQPPSLSLEESIRRIYSRVERQTTGASPSEMHVLAVDNKIVVVSKGRPASERSPTLRQALCEEFAAELGCDMVAVRTDVSLADDEKMEIFLLSRPLS